MGFLPLVTANGQAPSRVNHRMIRDREEDIGQETKKYRIMKVKCLVVQVVHLENIDVIGHVTETQVQSVGEAP